MERTDRPAPLPGLPPPAVRICVTPSSIAGAGWAACCSPTRPSRCRAATTSAEAARRRLDRVVGNPRFLILPWVRVGAWRPRPDWKARHGLLVETFVDPARFDGACYRAANWGKRSARTPKSVFVQPLDKDFRAILVEGRRRAPRPAPPGGSADALAQRWGPLIDAVVAVARDFDRHWQRRRRSLNTLLVDAFVFRLVFAKNGRGTARPWPSCGTSAVARACRCRSPPRCRPRRCAPAPRCTRTCSAHCTPSCSGAPARPPWGRAGRGIGCSRWTARS